MHWCFAVGVGAPGTEVKTAVGGRGAEKNVKLHKNQLKNLNKRQLWAAMWKLGMEPRSSGRRVSALYCPNCQFLSK